MMSTRVLCPHDELGYGTDWLQTLPVKPKAYKCFYPSVARRIKEIDHTIITVVRRYVPDQDSYLLQGYDGGLRFAHELYSADLYSCDYVGGLNEVMDTPENIQLAAEFDLGLIDALRPYGVKPISSSIAQGNPPDISDMRHYAATAQKILEAGGLLDYHGYTGWPVDLSEEWHLNRGPLKLADVLRQHGVSRPIRWIYGEIGYDDISYDPGYTGISEPGYKLLISRHGITKQQIQDGYMWMDHRCQELGVEMAFVYTFWGTDLWANYDHATDNTMLNWFKEFWMQDRNIQRARVLVDARVRAAPDPNAQVLGVLPAGSIINVVEWMPGWAKTDLQAGGVALKRSVIAPYSPYGFVVTSLVERI